MIPHMPQYEFHSIFASFIQGYLEQLKAIGNKTTFSETVCASSTVTALQ